MVDELRWTASVRLKMMSSGVYRNFWSWRRNGIEEKVLLEERSELHIFLGFNDAPETFE